MLEHGEILEQGSHEKLIKLKGAYFELHQNQLKELTG